jgi:hemerythrin-like domain-containing protein
VTEVPALHMKLLDDHARLRGKVSVIQSLALGILRGDDDLAAALRLKGEELQQHLIEHMSWEESELFPVLQDASSEGCEAARQLIEEHSTQRDRLAHSLEALRTLAGQPSTLAKHLLELVHWLEYDMTSEEERVMASLVSGQGAEGEG